MTLASGFGGLDWFVVAVYFVILAATGWVFSLRKPKTDREYFLGERNLPVWAVAISILATALSAATFIGVPHESYTGDLTYISLSIGSIVAVLFIAAFFIPVYYRENVTTVYQLLDRRFGPGARAATSWAFIIGRLLASGARVYIAAIPLTMILFGDLSVHLGPTMVAIAILMGVGTAYTLVGGMRSIIWTDVVQTIVFLGAAMAAIVVLFSIIGLPIGELFEVLRTSQTEAGGAKLALVDVGVQADKPWFGIDLSKDYTLLTALTGVMLLNLAALGADQDLAQRMLSCRSAAKGAQSAILSQIIAIPVVAIFLVIGLLLYVVNRRPDLVAPPTYELTVVKQTFPQFILERMPVGLKGLMMAGLFAAAITTILSALNAMSAAFVTDFYRKARPSRTDKHYLLVSRAAVVGWGVAVCGIAMLCAVWQSSTGENLIPFALRVISYAYAGLLGVYFCAIFTKQGSTSSVIAALITGAVVVLAMEPFAWQWWGNFIPISDATATQPARTLGDVVVAFPWRLTIAAVCAFCVCVLGKRPAPQAAAESGIPGR